MIYVDRDVVRELLDVEHYFTGFVMSEELSPLFFTCQLTKTARESLNAKPRVFFFFCFFPRVIVPAGVGFHMSVGA